MPQALLTEEQRAEALARWWAEFPYGTISQRQRAIHQFEQEYGPLTEDERRAALYRLSPEQKARLGISKQFLAPTDIGEKEALKLCGQLLDDKHYDLLLDETGMVEKPPSDCSSPEEHFELLCILLKNALPQSLLDEVRPV